MSNNKIFIVRNHEILIVVIGVRFRIASSLSVPSAWSCISICSVSYVSRWFHPFLIAIHTHCILRTLLSLSLSISLWIAILTEIHIPPPSFICSLSFPSSFIRDNSNLPFSISISICIFSKKEKQYNKETPAQHRYYHVRPINKGTRQRRRCVRSFYLFCFSYFAIILYWLSLSLSLFLSLLRHPSFSFLFLFPPFRLFSSTLLFRFRFLFLFVENNINFWCVTISMSAW